MNFDKESKSRIFFGGWGGGGGGEGIEGGGRIRPKEPPYFIHKTHRHDLFYRTYSLMQIFLTVFKIEGIVALTIKGR